MPRIVVWNTGEAQSYHRVSLRSRSNFMSDIFICYSRDDSSVALRLADRLRAERWSVFVDVGIPSGANWRKVLEESLHSAAAAVVLWSTTSRTSDYVLEEAEYARSRDVLFPAFIEQVVPPYGFARLQCADLVGWQGANEHPGLASLLTALHQHLDGRSQGRARVDRKPGDTFRDNLDCGAVGPLLKMLPPGRFRMGAPRGERGRDIYEGPVREVSIRHAFALGVYAVTYEEFDKYCAIASKRMPDDPWQRRGQFPVEYVSWSEAMAYCDWLSEQSGSHYTLPSEAQWEYACRSGTTTPYSFGESISLDQANFLPHDGVGAFLSLLFRKMSDRPRSVAVGTYPANAFDLREMHGNAEEWCLDCWHDNYEGAPADDSAWDDGVNTKRVVRGGSCFASADGIRSAKRRAVSGDEREQCLGLRVCRRS